MDALLSRHRKEAKDLQGRVTSKKKNATKKTRKGVNDECAELERQLKERHAAELAALEAGRPPDSIATSSLSSQSADGSTVVSSSEPVVLIDPFASDEPPSTSDDLASGVAELGVSAAGAANGHDTIAAGEDDVDAGGTGGAKRKGNRQKARLARRAAEQEAAATQAAAEAASLPDLRARERETVDAALAARGLVEREVRSDGHCLYAALADQLERAGVALGSGGASTAAPAGEEVGEGTAEGSKSLPDYKIVRRETAEYVLAHRDDFVPFLDEVEMEKGIEEYARKIGDTAEWGGQMEILAAARRWGLVVNVLQGDGRVEKIDGTEGRGGEGVECWLAYYRHSFGLGEHYNSLRKKS